MSDKDGGVTLGIDLGTTYSLAAILDGPKPVVLDNALGEQLTPSAVAVAEDGSILVGAPALALSSSQPERVARWFKRDMGTDRTITLGDRRFRPEELSALVLQEVRYGAEAALGRKVVEAVVTVPAYFGELQRRATRDACEIAGIHVERIINEPTAAALAYGLQARDQELKAVVLDLGGGTFDVSVLEIIEGVIEIQASAGDSRLGGEDFTDLLAGDLTQRIQNGCAVRLPAKGATPGRVRAAAERAKQRLTHAQAAEVSLPALISAQKTQDVSLELTRSEAEALWQPLLERMRQPIRRALRDAHLDAEQVDAVILVGGATRMPCVVDLAAQLFGKLPLRHLPPDSAVAMGAAVQAALKVGAAEVDDVVVTDVAPFSLGVASSHEVAGQLVHGLFTPIIERGTVLPSSRVETFFTVSDGQTEIAVKVHQGEHAMCKDNELIGSYTVKGIPSGEAGKESVEIRFTYDLNGILEVDTTVVATRKTKSLLIERSAGRLSPEQIKQTRKAMQGLKLHPRDALPNVTALSRADALYTELSGAERASLGEAIAAFKAALESQDPQQTLLMRKLLIERTQRYR